MRLKYDWIKNATGSDAIREKPNRKLCIFLLIFMKNVLKNKSLIVILFGSEGFTGLDATPLVKSIELLALVYANFIPCNLYDLCPACVCVCCVCVF